MQYDFMAVIQYLQLAPVKFHLYNYQSQHCIVLIWLYLKIRDILLQKYNFHCITTLNIIVINNINIIYNF